MYKDNSRKSLTSARRAGIGGRFGSSGKNHETPFTIYIGRKRLPSSRSFQADQAFSRHSFASSGRCCDIRTDANACRASGFPGSVCRAKESRSSQVFSTFGSKLNGKKMNKRN